MRCGIWLALALYVAPLLIVLPLLPLGRPDEPARPAAQPATAGDEATVAADERPAQEGLEATAEPVAVDAGHAAGDGEEPVSGQEQENPAGAGIGDEPGPSPVQGVLRGDVQGHEQEVPAATAASVGGDSVRALICARAWPCTEALAVASCESGLRPDATGRLGERGVFQITQRWHEGRFTARGWTWADAYDAAKNVAIAYEIWTESGWSQWSCKP
jgi:hypothetical protein